MTKKTMDTMEMVQEIVHGDTVRRQGAMMSTLDAENHLRAQLDIPEKYIVMEFDDNYYYHLSKKIEPSIMDFICKRDAESQVYTECVVTNQTHNSYIKGPYFVATNMEIYPSRSGDLGRLFIEKKNVEKFFEEYFKGEVPEKRAMPLVPNGVYNIKDKPFVGLQLSEVNVADIEPPLLNDDIGESLSKEIMMFRSKQSLYKDHNIEYKRGILLYGPAGNGKTSFIKTFVKEFDAISVLLNIKNDREISFIERFLGDTTYKDKLKIIIMEDIDGMDAHLRSLVLNLLDGVTSCSNTIFIATTNFPNKLDIAIAKRPSRFDSLYKIDVPNDKIRAELLLKFFGELDKDLLKECVEASKGLSGAYFKEIFLFSILNDLQPLEAIIEIKKRMKIFDDTPTYMG